MTLVVITTGLYAGFLPAFLIAVMPGLAGPGRPQPKEQAALIAGRTVGVLPSEDALSSAIEAAWAEGRPLRVKLGIDPTSSDVHLGHTVPMIILSRFQRMDATSF